MQAAIDHSGRLRVMLVDDDDSVREVLSEMLGLRGWIVGAFSDAEGAIEE